MDCLVKAISSGMRIYAAVTTDLVNEGLKRHSCNPLAGAALGRVMTGALLMAANLKNKEALTVKFDGDGPLGRVTADAVPEGYVRGYILHPEAVLPLENGKLAVGKGIGQGLVTVTRFTGLKEPVTGSCEIYSGEIAEDLTRYLYISEQTPSSFGLGVLIGRDKKAEAAGGFAVQLLPDAGDKEIEKLERNLKELRPVSAMIKDGFGAREIIGEVLKGMEVNYLSETELKFRCRCSKRRTEDILLTLSHDDLAGLVQDGRAEVCCDFCGEKYLFSKDELIAILNVSDELRRRKQVPVSFRKDVT